MKKKISILLAIALIISMIATGCGAKDEPAPASNQEAQKSTTEKEGKTSSNVRTDLNWQLFYEPTTLDPTYSPNAYDYDIIYQIFDTLFELDENGYEKLRNSLCTGFEMTDDAMEYTFNIREGVKFHNGEPLTAEDVAFTINRLTESPTTSSRFEMISKAEVVSDYVVKVKMATPCARLPQLLTACPTGIVCKKAIDEFGNASPSVAIGTGAYKVESWTPGQGIVLSAFEDYWDGAPAIKTVNYYVISDPTAIRVKYESGELDRIYAQSAEDMEKFRADENSTSINYTLSSTTNLCFNTKRKLLADENLRKAIATAINAPDLIMLVTGGIWSESISFVPKAAQGYTDKVPQYSYDVEKAQEYLAKSNYNGEEIGLMFYSNSAASTGVATVIQAYLAGIGINVKMDGAETATVTQRIADKDFDMTLLEITFGLPYSIVTYNSLYRSDGYYNVFGWNNAEVDSIIDSVYLMTDSNEQNKALEKVNIAALEECLYAPLYAGGGCYFIPSKLNLNTVNEPATANIKIRYFTWSE